MRTLILFLALLGAGLAVGCSDNGNSGDQASGQTSSDGGGDTSLSIDTEDDSASYSNGDTSISVNEDDGGNSKSE